MDKIFLLKLENGSQLEVRADSSLVILPKDLCVFNKDFYEDLGEVIRELATPSMTARPEDLPSIKRLATKEDIATANQNIAKSRQGMKTTQEWVDNLNLPMKLINTHYSLDGKQVIVQFSSDGRVDFRELVKELSHALSTRIELRQIGVRDETGIYGGIGVCGQQLCCSRFLKEFNSINVKMAKEQDLALTPTTISGVCGRLKCCLKYEHEGYVELEKGMPRKGEICDTPDGRGRITDRNLLTRKVSVTMENGNIISYHIDNIKVLPKDKNKNPNKVENTNNTPCQCVECDVCTNCSKEVSFPEENNLENSSFNDIDNNFTEEKTSPSPTSSLPIQDADTEGKNIADDNDRSCDDKTNLDKNNHHHNKNFHRHHGNKHHHNKNNHNHGNQVNKNNN
jgi:cell fate regulator YaaT (PSP1 superfamily)